MKSLTIKGIDDIQLELLRRAAKIDGRSMSKYVLMAAIDKSKKDLMRDAKKTK